MNRFKIKFNGMEMKLLAACASYIGRKYEVASLRDMVDVETMSRIWSRLRNMFRPDKDRYTVQFSSVEVMIIVDVIIPFMMDNGDALSRALAFRMQQETDSQINREINIYNSINHG